jgi:hypothetical protein
LEWINGLRQMSMQEEKPKSVQSQVILSEEEKKDIEENRKMAAISYLSILYLIPLFSRGKSKFAQFHARQGLILLIIGIILPFFRDISR